MERKLTYSETEPISPNTGDGWIHTTTRIEKIWDGSSWKAIMSDLSQDKMWAGDTDNRPIEEDRPSGGGGGVSYTELAGTDTATAATQGAGDGAWATWDLSAIIGTGATMVEVGIKKLVASDEVGIRKNGSALVRKLDLLKAQIVVVQVECDANRIIEIESDDVSDSDIFSVLGYWS